MITKRIHKRSTALEQSINTLEGFNMFNGTNYTLNNEKYFLHMKLIWEEAGKKEMKRHWSS